MRLRSSTWVPLDATRVVPGARSQLRENGSLYSHSWRHFWCEALSRLQSHVAMLFKKQFPQTSLMILLCGRCRKTFGHAQPLLRVTLACTIFCVEPISGRTNRIGRKERPRHCSKKPTCTHPTKWQAPSKTMMVATCDMGLLRNLSGKHECKSPGFALSIIQSTLCPTKQKRTAIPDSAANGRAATLEAIPRKVVLLEPQNPLNWWTRKLTTSQDIVPPYKEVTGLCLWICPANIYIQKVSSPCFDLIDYHSCVQVPCEVSTSI